MGNPSIQHLAHVDLTVIVPVIAHAVAVFGDEHKASHWLSTPLPILAGHTPTEILQTPGGVARIETILTRIEHNIPS
jgi:putative toxin-antitoxin system antitoxin component (TIGR02293 family)